MNKETTENQIEIEIEDSRATMGCSCCLLGRRATAVGVAAPAERERPASCDVAKPGEALRAAAGMAKEELSSVAVAMADGRTDGNGMGSLDQPAEPTSSFSARPISPPFSSDYGLGELP